MVENNIVKAGAIEFKHLKEEKAVTKAWFAHRGMAMRQEALNAERIAQPSEDGPLGNEQAEDLDAK